MKSVEIGQTVYWRQYDHDYVSNSVFTASGMVINHSAKGVVVFVTGEMNKPPDMLFIPWKLLKPTREELKDLPAGDVVW